MSIQVRKILFQLVTDIKTSNDLTSPILAAKLKQLTGQKLTSLEEAILQGAKEDKGCRKTPVYLDQIFQSAGWIEEGTNKPFVDQDLLIQVLNALPNETSRTLFMHAYEEELEFKNYTYRYEQGLLDSAKTYGGGCDRVQTLDSYAKQFNLEDLDYAEPK